MHPGDLLSAYLDDQLDAAERPAIDSHLVDCPGCRSEIDALTVARATVRSLPPVDPPPGALSLPAPVKPLRRHRRTLVAGAAAAAAALVLAVGAGSDQSVPLPLDAVVEQHVARASVDPGFNVLQVQAVRGR